MNSFYSLTLFSVLFIPGVFPYLGNLLKEPLTTAPPPTTAPITTTTHYVITTAEAVAMVNRAKYEGNKYEGNIKAQRDQKIQEQRQLSQARWNSHNGFAHRCKTEKTFKIKDQFGCEICTCIYEKSFMFCSPYECRSQYDTLLGELGPSLYNDYIINVETRFFEQPCVKGEVLLASAICECTCVAKDIVSCPSMCQMGRQLN